MIFVTVGTQLTFDRLINTVDQWAATINEKVVAQIGPSELTPRNMEWHQFLSPIEFSSYMEESRVIIAHAGMGSILTAMELQKPIIIFPRRAKLNEHRNEHQLATARRFVEIDGIHVALDENQLLHILHNMDSLAVSSKLCSGASDELIKTVSDFIEDC